MVRLSIPADGLSHTIKRVPVPLWPTGQIILAADFPKAFPDTAFPKMATITIEPGPHAIAAIWQTDIGTQGTADLYPSEASLASELTAEQGIRSWDEFKRFALDLPSRSYIFRGQSNPHRLRSSFHRTWRKDLGRYVDEDIDALRLALAGMTKHFFRHDMPHENAAFYSLLQHHGYPTPLLDWSYSPFVAAYFAYNPRRTPTDSEAVRIFVFDKHAWRADWKEFGSIAYTPPHFTVMDILALDNPRSIPQQALSTLTNCDDIEGFIHYSERVAKKTYLRCVDLPASERPVVLHELTSMGITAGSLFPGIDGACEQVRRRLFGINV